MYTRWDRGRSKAHELELVVKLVAGGKLGISSMVEVSRSMAGSLGEKWNQLRHSAQSTITPGYSARRASA